MLTLYVFPADSDVEAKNFDNTVNSFGFIADEAILVKDRNISELAKQCKTQWFGYIFTDECLSMELAFGLPNFLVSNYDVIICMRRHFGNKISRSPRFFRNHVQIKDGSMLPIKTGDIQMITALDGFIENYES